MERNISLTKISRTAFGVVLAINIIIALFYVYNIAEWRNYPDFGFKFRQATGANVIGGLRDNGRKAGLQVGDRILHLNGKPYSTLKEGRKLLHWELGAENYYLIERDGKKLEVKVENIPIGLLNSIKLSGPSFLIGLCYILIGMLIFMMKPHTRVSWIFFIFCTMMGLSFIFIKKVGLVKPAALDNVYLFASVFRPAVFIHLGLVFPAERQISKKYFFINYLPYIISGILFFLCRLSSITLSDVPRILFISTILYLLIALLIFLGSCIQLLVRSTSHVVRLRAKVILLGAALAATIPLVDSFLNVIFNIYLVPNTKYYLPFFVFFPLAIGYSIVKHDLFDIDAIIKRTYGYILTTGSVAAIYGIFVLVTNVVFGHFELTRSPMFPMFFILAIVFLFNPIRNWAQRTIDRLFYRLEYDYQATVQKISESMRSLLKVEEIGRNMMDTALGTMFIDTGHVIISAADNNSYVFLEARDERIKSATEQLEEKRIKSEENISKRIEAESNASIKAESISFPVDDPFFVKLAEQRKEVTIYDIEENPYYADNRPGYIQIFDELKAELIIPLIIKDRLIGIISLGSKKSGKFYRQEDLNLLKILADQSAVALENARLFEENIEKTRMEEELKIAHDIQISMLPEQSPDIAGYSIAASSFSAREVGGDFYDFIEMGQDDEKKLGIIVGDVSGKAVSGALVMAASRSIFRVLADAKASVRDMVLQGNRRLKHDVKKGMFVALSYALLDPLNKKMTIVNAGQTQPILCSNPSGEPQYIDPEGDRFPLGIIEDCDYQEAEVSLKSGDMVVFYTDGIVEAMNGIGDMYGFDRFIEVIKENKSLDADEFLMKLMADVNHFVGDAEQHDDLTIVAVKVH